MADGMERENPDQVDSPNVDVRSRDSDDTQSSPANSQNVEHDEILVSFQVRANILENVWYNWDFALHPKKGAVQKICIMQISRF